MVTIICPECQQSIKLNSDLIVGQQTICQHCDTDFVVTWLFPLCLDFLETKEQIEASPGGSEEKD